ncbi:S8 family serine peptidase [Spongisporangium articulatum]|uniref:S8 family serine peptidase n=1 Tax=Spongisporangium articulatum TaxID=3362603 RepID=A0ABW8ATY4_9ACTN
MTRRLTALTAALLLAATALGIGTAAPTSARALPKPDEDQWWFTVWGIEKVWATGARGQGITVAVIDDGVDASRPELKGRVLPGLGFDGSNPWKNSTSRGHGTAMAVYIAGQGHAWAGAGVAPEAKILPITNGPGLTDLGKQIRYAVDHGAKVINMSIATENPCDDAIDLDIPAAVRYAVDHGALLFAGAGNDGRRTDNVPADCPGVVSVAAVDDRAKVWTKSTRSSSVALAAPGVHMASRNSKGAEGYSDGTSDATALMSGAAALVWSKYPDLTNRQILARLLASAKDIGPKGPDDASGFGIALPLTAIQKKIPADAPNPVFDALDRALPPGSGNPTSSPTPDTDTGGVPGASSGTAASSGPKPVVIIGGLGALLIAIAGGAIAFIRTRRRPH